MMRNWMIAAACAVAWGGVAGCSGGGAPAAPTDPADPGPTDPANPAPDGGTGTDGQAAFDAALESAAQAQAEAEQLVAAAEAAAGDVGTDEARTAARAAIKAARDALAKAVADARALVALARGNANLRGQAEDRIGKATAAQTAGEARLVAGEAGVAAAQVATRWSARAGIGRSVAPTLPEVRAVRTIRSDAAGTADNPNLLKITTHPAVPYEAGKVLISEGEAASGDMLPMWGFGSDRIFSRSREFAPLYNRDHLTSPNLDANSRAELDGYVFLAALRITPAGLVMEIGGRGSEGMDLRRVVGVAGGGTGPGIPPEGVYDHDSDPATPPVADPYGWDLTLTFGEPTVSPEGNGEAYWEARLMPDPGQIAIGADADTRAKLLVDGRPYQIGTYKLWLSNHVGAETNLEPAEGSSAEAYPDDDENTFLEYAAYGMMTFATSDRFSRSTGSTGTGWKEIRDRVNAFHLGYDAFEDESGKRTTDIGEAVTDGKFTGLTIALELDSIQRGSGDSLTAIDMRVARRLRGEVELTATISGTASDNSIKGKIRNLEVWDVRGYWKDYASIPGDITLASASIGADGHYIGGIERVPGFGAMDTSDFGLGGSGAPGDGGSGRYLGAFYGSASASALETAGVWHLTGTNSGAGAVQKAVVGSFGAKLPPSASE